MSQACPCSVESDQGIVTTPPDATQGERYTPQAAFGYLRRYHLGLVDQTPENNEYSKLDEIEPISNVARACANLIVDGECSKWVFVEETDGFRKLFPRDLFETVAVADRPTVIDVKQEYL